MRLHVSRPTPISCRLHFPNNSFAALRLLKRHLVPFTMFVEISDRRKQYADPLACTCRRNIGLGESTAGMPS